ncbi:hypothetical protein, partial [Heyndrickxia sporothermodurans]
MSNQKKRIEVRLDKKIDKDVIYHLDHNVDNAAGLIKTLLRDYVRSQKQRFIQEDASKIDTVSKEEELDKGSSSSSIKNDLTNTKESVK